MLMLVTLVPIAGINTSWKDSLDLVSEPDRQQNIFMTPDVNEVNKSVSTS